MRRAALIFNPNAGQRHGSRIAALQRAADVLHQGGIEAEIVPTSGPGTAGAQAADAVSRGADLVFACGGDGTFHEIIQGLAGKLNVTTGVLPLGSANALARHLGLSFNAPEAVRQQLGYIAHEIPLGRITYQTAEGTSTRYFAVMAGAGPDGMLVYRMLAAGKQRLGRSVYYLRAAKLFLTSRFPPFKLTAKTGNETVMAQDVVSAMTIRVGDLGGIFSPLARGASPDDDCLHLTVTSPPSHLALPAWFATSWARRRHWNRYTRHLQVDSFACSTASDQRIPVQADGEFLGYTPMHVELVPNALRLLMPTSPTAR